MNDDGFLMNITMNTTPKTPLPSKKDKKKDKKEKYLERRLVGAKRKRENNKKKHEFNNSGFNSTINNFKPKPFRGNAPKTNPSSLPNEETHPVIPEKNTNDNPQQDIPQKETQNFTDNTHINNIDQEVSHQNIDDNFTEEKPVKKQKLTASQKSKQNFHREELTKEIHNEINEIASAQPQSSSFNPSKSVFSIKTFEDLNINQYLKRALTKSGYTTMTKVQKKSIPILLQHKNVVVKSETGSGKTLAYVVPLYEQLFQINEEAKINRKDGVYSIIFSPTHELCLQIQNTFDQVKSSCIHVVYGSLMGGQKIEFEKKMLRKGLNVIITTPGRLLYHLKNTSSLNFSTLKTIIFDEADCMLDMGFEKDIKECFRLIFKKLEGYNENLNEEEKAKFDEKYESLEPEMFKKYKMFLISATIDGKIRRMTHYLMKGFKAVGFEQKKDKEKAEGEKEDEDEEDFRPANGLNQFYSFINDEFRLINLIAFIYNNLGKKIIIFVSTCDATNFLHRLISQIDVDENYEIESKKDQSKAKPSNNKVKLIPQTAYKLHGKMKHDERKQIFNQFNQNKLGILICTDVAARGLDFPLVDWVIHYDVNPDVKEYVNRMGRTARLDHEGNSLLFLMKNERILLDSCLKKIKESTKEILSSNILLTFVENLNKNILKNKIEPKPMPFDDEVDENEKFRKKYIFAVVPIQRMIKDFIFADRENLALARSAFKSEVRSYVTFLKYQKEVFNVKALNLTRLSRSFGLYKESMKMKVGNSDVVVDHEYEKVNVKAERKYLNKKIQNKLIYSEFE